MFRKKFSLAIALLGLILFIASLHMSSVSAQVTMQPANSLWLDPAAISYNQGNGTIGTMFNVTAWTNLNVSSFTWQVKLLFNTTYLQCAGAGLSAGSTSQFWAGHATVPGGPTIDNATGIVTIGETLLGADTKAPGNGSLAWFEFKIVVVPNATITPITDSLNISNAVDNYVLDPDLSTINSTNVGATYSSLYDVTTPTIADPTQNPINGSIADMQNVTVSANVTDNAGGSGIWNVTLSYSTDNTTFTNTAMTLNATTGNWTGTLPGYSVGTTVYYKIVAYDNAGNFAVNSNTGNWSYLVPEFTSVLTILMLLAMASAVLLMRKKIMR
jgi:hypothetical protein